VRRALVISGCLGLTFLLGGCDKYEWRKVGDRTQCYRIGIIGEPTTAPHQMCREKAGK
jgi:hypothetical protein